MSDTFFKFTLQPTFPNIHNSDNATARPPFEQSCTFFTNFFEIKESTDVIFFFDVGISTLGTVPPIKLWTYS